MSRRRNFINQIPQKSTYNIHCIYTGIHLCFKLTDPYAPYDAPVSARPRDCIRPIFCGHWQFFGSWFLLVGADKWWIIGRNAYFATVSGWRSVAVPSVFFLSLRQSSPVLFYSRLLITVMKGKWPRKVQMVAVLGNKKKIGLEIKTKMIKK